MKHAILGAGAIGGLVGTALGSLGEDVTVVVRPEKLASYPEELSLERPSGSITAPAKAVATLTEPVDVLWIATKTYQLQTALEAVPVSPGCVVPLLNGVDHIAVLRARFGHEQVVPGTIAVEAERIAPGRFIQRSPFVRLNLASSGELLLGAIVAQLRNVGFTCQFIPNEQTLLWSKVCFLATAGAGDVGVRYEPWRDPCGRGMETKVEFYVRRNMRGGERERREVDARQIQAFYKVAPPAMRSSMQKDLRLGGNSNWMRLAARLCEAGNVLVSMSPPR